MTNFDIDVQLSGSFKTARRDVPVLVLSDGAGLVYPLILDSMTDATLTYSAHSVPLPADCQMSIGRS